MMPGPGLDETSMTPSSMRAARFHSATGELVVEQVPVPQPGPLEVLVRVRACGICLSDVHMLDGALPTPLETVTPGHEAAGVVAASGALALGWEVGARVVMAGGKVCGTCAMCSTGRFDRCASPGLMGSNYDGAWAEFIAVPASVLTRIPSHLPFEQAAIIADAVTTPYAGLVNRAQLVPGESVGLWGIGGLGVHAVQIARWRGAGLILAIDPHPAARERALRAGADVAIDPTSTDVEAAIMAATGGLGLDLAVDLVGSNAVLRQGASVLGRSGRLLMIGLSMEPLELGPGVLFGVGRHTLLGHLGYAKDDLDAVVQLVSRGVLDLSSSISGVLSLDEVSDGVDRLRTRRGDPVRLVLAP